MSAAPPTLRERGVEGARHYLLENSANGPVGPEVASVENIVIDAPVPIGARVYRPTSPGALPTVIYFHGGGWVIGGLDTSDEFCRRLANEAPCVVVSVDYRLAPECPWPAAVDDAVAAIRWGADHAQHHGGDPTRLVVLGDSAGGNVATVAVRRLRDAHSDVVRHQVLAYPSIGTTQDHPSHTSHGNAWPLTNSDLAWFVEMYVPTPDDRLDPDVCPLLADVAHMPPTTMVLAGCDPLFDEGLAYTNHLIRAGVPTSLHVFAGQIHGFVTFPENRLPGSRAALGVVANAIRCA